jgi:hypothetical protein
MVSDNDALFYFELSGLLSGNGRAPESGNPQDVLDKRDRDLDSETPATMIKMTAAAAPN